MRIRAKFRTICGKCGEAIAKGDLINWTMRERASCSVCGGRGAII